MKRKGLLTATLLTALVIGSAFTAFAGNWEEDERGWRYRQNDGTYIKSHLKEETIGHLEDAGDGTGLKVWVYDGMEEQDYGDRVNYTIDGNGDGIAESYYFDLEGYLLTNTTVKNVSYKDIKVNNEGAELDKNGKIVTTSIPRGEIRSNIGNGAIRQEFIDILMKGIDAVDAKFGTSEEDRSYGDFLHIGDYDTISPIKPIGFNLQDDKVVYVTVPSSYLFVTPPTSVYDISAALNTTGEMKILQGLGGGYIYQYTWVLQENPKVTLKLNDTLYTGDCTVFINVHP